MISLKKRLATFCAHYGLRTPLLLAPMAGVPAPALSIAVAKAGGLGACGVLLMSPAEIKAWVDEVRSQSSEGFQLNLWAPGPPPIRDPAHEAAVMTFLGQWGPPVAPEAGDATPPDFGAQCAAVLEARPAVASSIMGLFPPSFVSELRDHGIAWFATATTVAEAKLAEDAGADAIIAQGMEAGGHRGSFDARDAESKAVGLFALLPAIVDCVQIPIVAAGGIGDARGIAAAIVLGASAVQIGTAFLRCPEAGIQSAWADALAGAKPEDTVVSRAFSGRAGRSLATSYVIAATDVNAPAPAPYPVQRGLTAAMRAAASRSGDVQRMQAWAGQSAALARDAPAYDVVRSLWEGASRMLDL